MRDWARVRKWDVHIHCDQHFQSGMFRIFVCRFDLVSGPLWWCRLGILNAMPMWALERHGTGGEIERERELVYLCRVSGVGVRKYDIHFLMLLSRSR